MKLKTFSGKTMAEVLSQVKRQFGRDAVILNTRTLTKGGLFGIGGKSYVEITAARRMSDVPVHVRRRTPEDRLERIRRTGKTVPSRSPAAGTTSLHPPDAILSEVSSLKSMVYDLVRETRRAQAPNVPDALFDVYQRLIENEVAEQIAQRLIEQVRNELTADQLRDPATVRAKLSNLLVPMLPTAGPIRCAPAGEPVRIAFIGPTGVGKTTTIAKLAASFCLREQRKVGLVTIDTYRIAAVEQLKTYAEIIDVPLEVASSPEQFKEVMARLADRELILIDTAGRSQRDEFKMKELRGFFRAVRPHEIHLVLSSACGEAVLAETIERFRGFGIDKVILTKLDEAIGFGVILTCLQKADAGLSYVTTGQDVPDDIEVGESQALVELILREPALQRSND